MLGGARGGGWTERRGSREKRTPAANHVGRRTPPRHEHVRLRAIVKVLLVPLEIVAFVICLLVLGAIGFGVAFAILAAAGASGASSAGWEPRRS